MSSKSLVQRRKSLEIGRHIQVRNEPEERLARFGAYCRQCLNTSFSYHGPCLFATELANPKKPWRI